MLKLQYFDHLDVKSQLIGKDPDVRKDWGQEKKGATEDEMVGGQHWLDERESEWTLRDSEGQGHLEYHSPRGHRVGHDLVTEQQQNIKDISPWFLAYLLILSFIV